MLILCSNQVLLTAALYFILKLWKGNVIFASIQVVLSSLPGRDAEEDTWVEEGRGSVDGEGLGAEHAHRPAVIHCHKNKRKQYATIKRKSNQLQLASVTFYY